MTVRYLDTDTPVAFSFHAPEPTVVMSRMVQQRLTAQEFEAVIAHERAHLRERHHVALRLANINSACLPAFRPAQQLMESTRFLVELIADDVAATECGSEAVESALSMMAVLTGLREAAARSERLRAKRESKTGAVAPWNRVLTRLLS